MFDRITRVLRRFGAIVPLGLICVWLGGGGTAQAHDFRITDTLIVLMSDGTYQVDLIVDVDALALGVALDVDSAENVAALKAMSLTEFEGALERAMDTIRRRTRLRFDGEKQRPRVSFPGLDHPSQAPSEFPSVMGTTARLTGQTPQSAVEMTFGASRVFGPVHLTILDQSTASGIRHLLGVSEDSPPHRLDQAADSTSSGLGVAGAYVRLGFEHILPRGLDHILFVLSLFLLSTKLKPLLWQVTAFTVAHSMTLALSMAGALTLPSRWVESLIALSIVYVAIENLATQELKPWRPALVFGFGLLHGLGFAGVLRELGIPAGEFATALVAFNVGVEAGQLAVILLALLAVGWFRNRDGYRKTVVLPLSLGIALVGVYWTVERAFGGG
jgi:hypothetical protein